MPGTGSCKRKKADGAASAVCLSLSKKSFLSIFWVLRTPVLLRKPLENCLRAVRHGPHFVQSTKPQFSEVSAFRKGRRCTATENRRTTCEKARFPAPGKCRPSRMAGKRFFGCPDSIRTPGLMPLPFPRFFEKNRVKLLIFRTFPGNRNASADFYVSAKFVFRQSETALDVKSSAVFTFQSFTSHR